MPEFVLQGRDEPDFQALSQFEQGYIEALFWADTPDGEDWSFTDLHPSALERIKNDCARFLNIAGVADAVEHNAVRAGHDFWLTRNGHGSGFWGRPEIWGTNTDLLTEASKSIGNVDAYKGDDGKIYFG